MLKTQNSQKEKKITLRCESLRHQTFIIDKYFFVGRKLTFVAETRSCDYSRGPVGGYVENYSRHFHSLVWRKEERRGKDKHALTRIKNKNAGSRVSVVESKPSG